MGRLFLLTPASHRVREGERSRSARRARAKLSGAVGASILVVDDQPDLGEMLSAMIRRDGHEVRIARSAQEALGLVDERVPDLVLTDLGMPGMSGLDLADALRVRWPDLPIALVTGWGPTLDLARLEEAKIVDVLGKPFRIAEVRELVRRVLDVR